MVIADDHPPIIDCLSRHLAAAGFSVVGSAQNGEAALAVIEQMHPLVCVADVNMPRLDGLELARRAAVSAPDTAVLLYSGVSDKGLVSDALDAGAHGFALKDAPLDDLSRAIDTVAAGGLYVDPVLAAALATRRTTSARRSPSASAKCCACSPTAAPTRRSAPRSSSRPTRCERTPSGR